MAGTMPESAKDLARIKLPLRWLMRKEEEDEVQKNICRENFKHNFRESDDADDSIIVSDI